MKREIVKYSYKSQHPSKDADSANFPYDDNIFKMHCHELIDDIPIEKLRQIFKFRMVKPFSYEAEKKLMDENTPSWEIREILRCRNIAINIYETIIHL